LEKTLANIKSQIKRNRQNEKRRIHNRNFRGAARTAVTIARTSFTQNDPETKEAVLKAISMLDKAAQKGVIHLNNASRRKGRLMKRLAAFNTVTPSTEGVVSKKKKVVESGEAVTKTKKAAETEETAPKKKKAAAPKKTAAKKKSE
jgi:small subunit ribosomal protein S20